MSDAAGIFLRGVLAAGLIAVMLLAVHGIASSEPARNFPLEHHTWLHDLYAPPPSNEHCCTAADCWLVPARIVGNDYQAFYMGEWIDIPQDRIVRTANPTPEAVLCIRSNDRHVYCYIRGPEG